MVRAIDLERQAPKVKSKGKKINWNWLVNLMVGLGSDAVTLAIHTLRGFIW
jgi:hypothetical protein